MALFSFKHSVRSFSDKRTIGARKAEHGQTATHLSYITRTQAARCVLRERLAGKTDAETGVIAEQEAAARKGRVCERFILALPVEATPTQREALVKEFCEAITKGAAGYVAAIHDMDGNDIANPHAHVVAFDVHEKTGGRGRPRSTIGMARKNAVETTAALWATIHNRMMDVWGYDQSSHITHLSYAARGIDRIPQIHEGPASRQISRRGEKITAKPEWHHIDQGHSRAQANAVIREINSFKEMANGQAEYPEHRLGRYHDDDGAERGDRRKNVRTHRGSVGRDLGNAAPPFAAVEPIREGLRGNQEPALAKASTMSPPFVAASCPSKNPSISIDRRLRHGARIRRIFRELVMLRDTLRARLLRRSTSARGQQAPDIEPSPIMRPFSRTRPDQHCR